jgi:hypothetical protein
MISFLKLALLLFVVLFIALVWIIYSFYKQVRKNAQRFGFFTQHANPKREGEETIIDKRSMEQRTKKVIKDNEGEYVNFTETNNPSDTSL